MPWWIWVALAIGVLAGIGQIVSQHGTASPKAIVRNAKRRANQPAAVTFNRDAVPMHEGMPYPGEAIRRAKALFAAGQEVEALDLLHDCRNMCGKMGMTASVQTLSDEIMGLRQQHAADAVAGDLLAAIAHHPDGIMQTALYEELPGIDTDIARFACYRLAEAGRITREKKGRSYILRLTEPR